MRFSSMSFVLTLFLVCLLILIGGAILWISNNGVLTTMQQWLSWRYNAIHHVNADNVDQLSDEDTVLFDVREQDEYDISHLPGAIRVAPDILPDHFMATYGKDVGSKNLVFYCSVGLRSSILAERVHHHLEQVQQASIDSRTQASNTRIFNLKSGIFQWHNDNRALVDETGSTQHVHPFSNLFQKLLKRPELARYSAIKNVDE